MSAVLITSVRQRNGISWLLLALPWALLLATLLNQMHHVTLRSFLHSSGTLGLPLEAAVRETWIDAPASDTVLSALLAPASCTSPPPPFAFLHLPKTGGTSVVSYLRTNLDAWCQEVHLSPDLSFVTAIHKGAAAKLRSQQQARRPQRNCSYSHLLAGPEGDARPAYAAMVLGEGFRIQHVLGHLPFGFCRLVDTGCNYVTLLREPVQRLASHWGYLRHKHPDLLRRSCGGGADCETLGGFAAALTSGKAQGVLVGMDNMQTRMLAGDGFLATISGNKVCTANSRTAGCDTLPSLGVGPEVLELAKYNLERYFKVVGVLEDLPGFMHDMGAAYCFRKRVMPGLNQLGTGSRVRNGTAEVLAAIARTQHLDVELYQFALKLIVKRRAQRAVVASLAGHR